MSTAATADRVPRSPARPELVRRDLVHRANEQEILVSPPGRANGAGYDSMTVTTGISPYYLDHPGPYWLDALLLTEACRQAALSAAHEFEGLSSDIAFFFNSIDVEITDPAALAAVRGELTLHTEFEQLQLRVDGSPKQIAYAQTGIDNAGREVLRTTMAVQGVPKRRYEDLRAYQRDGTPPPTTAVLRSDPGRRAGLSTPHSVARSESANVALARRRTEEGVSVAELAPDFANASLFDHDYDHFPAMVLIEAGRQLVLADTPWPAGHVVTAVRATFDHFAELDRATRLVARHSGRWVDVDCVQDGLVVTRMSFALAEAGTDGGDAS
ncbi:AfsA-related hotdog domain-containing protein [Streptomyces sp. NPDC056975]|uniref:AfsA-related hotdog domain-containing protein n=1 Tax=Streptomyces sp. NPDC056975 TaxID=3345985 RepID=UPI00362FA4BE